MMRHALALSLALTLTLSFTPAAAQSSLNLTPTTGIADEIIRGIPTGFSDLMGALCGLDTTLGTIPILDTFRIDLPGLNDLGIDLRPLCQYAHIVTRADNLISGMIDGGVRSTQTFIDDTIDTLANSISSALNETDADNLLNRVRGQLQAARDDVDDLPDVLSAYRNILNDATNEIRAATTREITNRAAQRSNDGDALATGDLLIDAARQAGLDTMSERGVETQILSEAATIILEQQLDSNAYQQTVEDTIRIDPTGASGGTAQELEARARSANSVRQAVNVLTEGIAAMLRNDAILTGAVIENLQASSQQQAITNHQLQVLTSQLIAQHEAEIEAQMAEVQMAMNTEREEMSAAITSMVTTLEIGMFVTDPQPMLDYGFNFCAMFPSQC